MRSEAIRSPQIEAVPTSFPARQPDEAKASFGDELKKSLEQVVALETEANKAVTKAAGGGAEQIHETMIKMEAAELSLRLLTKVRTKVLDAYQEVMRMQF